MERSLGGGALGGCGCEDLVVLCLTGLLGGLASLPRSRGESGIVNGRELLALTFHLKSLYSGVDCVELGEAAGVRAR